jgi:hypothetical protein
MRLPILIGLMVTLLTFPIVLDAQTKKAKVVPNAKTPTVKNKKVKVKSDTGLKLNPTEVAAQKNTSATQGKTPLAGITNYPEAGIPVSNKFDLNEAQVNKLEGTVMVQHADGSRPTALGTLNTVHRGDIITVYDKSWVVFKTRRGDKIGLDGNTVLSIDEYYFGGPDRQVRLVLQKGSLFLKTNNANSRQSFFEVNTGTVVTSVGDTEALFEYDKAKDNLKLQYMRGKLKVIDKNEEQKFTYENTIHHWEAGVMKEVEALPMDQLDGINFKKFLNGEKRLPPTDANMLLKTGE